MRRFSMILSIAGLGLLTMLAFGPLMARAAGDASAIRRATRTSDSRYVSNYRPGSTQTSYGRRTSHVRTTPRSATVGCRGAR